MSMKHPGVPALVGTALLGLSGCGGGDNNTPPLTGAIRVANGISDSTGLNMSITDTTSFSAVAVDGASNIKYVPVSAVVNYEATLTTNGTSFTVGGISADQDKLTTIFAFGEMSGGTQGGFPAEMSVNSPTNGQFVMQPVHAALQNAANALSLNFYFVKPGVCSTAVVGATANGSATFKTSPNLFALAGGTYEICVTDGAGTVLFDSGPVGIALPTSNANVFQIAAYDAPTGKGNGSTLVLSLLDNAGGNTALYNLKN
jgi:hypothetical protein